MARQLLAGHALIKALVASTFMVLSQAVQKITYEQMEGLAVDPSSKGIVMSCPMAQASVSAFEWKPTNLFNGFETSARVLRKLGCKLPVYNVLYEDEFVKARARCKQLSDKIPGVSCVSMAKDGQQDYGYAKVYAVDAAPVNQVLFIDCDAFFVRDPTYLFEDGNFTKTGALFWADIEGHYGSEKYRVDAALQLVPPERKKYADSWWFRQGYDSGLLLVDKARSSKPFGVLKSMLKSPGDGEHGLLELLSMGDKDLWHVAWLAAGPVCDEHACPLNPLATMIGQCMPDDNMFHMSSQSKVDRDGHVVALHQLQHTHTGMDDLVSPTHLLSINIVGRSPPDVARLRQAEDKKGEGHNRKGDERFLNDLYFGIHGGGLIHCDTMQDEFGEEALSSVPMLAQNLVVAVHDCWLVPDKKCVLAL